MKKDKLPFDYFNINVQPFFADDGSVELLFQISRDGKLFQYKKIEPNEYLFDGVMKHIFESIYYEFHKALNKPVMGIVKTLKLKRGVIET